MTNRPFKTELSEMKAFAESGRFKGKQYYLTYIVSYVVWSVWCLAGGESFLLNPVAAHLAKIAVFVIVWTAPVLVSSRGSKGLWSQIGRAFSVPFPWLPTVIGICVTAIFLHTAHILLVGINKWSPFQFQFVILAITTAAAEELIFRGIYFNGQASSENIYWAAASNAVMFALYHFPEFLIGRNLGAFLGFRLWMIAVVGFLFSWMFSKWKHLGMTILIHFVWNLLCYWLALA